MAMDRRGGGGCCIARYTGAGGTSSTSGCNLSKYDQIMLRYRPIAPKPATSVDGSAAVGSGFWSVKSTQRGKRRCLKQESKRYGRKRKLSSAEQVHDHKTAVVNPVTLPLLPEKPDLTHMMRKYEGNNDDCGITRDRTVRMVPAAAAAASAKEVVVGDSQVTVECVTDTWLHGEAAVVLRVPAGGSAEEEMRMRLKEDTCPGFISDRWNRVTWTNEAFKKMTTVVADEAAGDSVGLVIMRSGKVADSCSGTGWFSCRVRVRVQHTWRSWKEEGSCNSSSLTVPADVWRMDGGVGFAWRLDVEAALRLGW
ncbi:hypothetical protein Dimus_004632 [Dionaea muscipula]